MEEELLWKVVHAPRPVLSWFYSCHEQPHGPSTDDAKDTDTSMHGLSFYCSIGCNLFFYQSCLDYLFGDLVFGGTSSLDFCQFCSDVRDTSEAVHFLPR